VGSIPTLGSSKWADSSAAERLAYTEEVTGSNPVSPRFFELLRVRTRGRSVAV
jgi:hypothetical protein